MKNDEDDWDMLVKREWNLKLAFHSLMVHQGVAANVVMQIKTVINENLNCSSIETQKLILVVNQHRTVRQQ